MELDNKFSVGDKVKARGVDFWLTITHVMPCGWYDTRFGSIGGRCGTFKAHDLELIEG